ncbi:MAG: efflux RND transporter periplasmic adaptor subunit [Flavobacteriales bacterium]
MRKIIIIAVGLLIIAAGMATMQMMSAKGERPQPKSVDKVTTVFTEKVKLTEVPVYIESTGVLEALEKLELYSEVQGVMLPDGGKFKEGRTFRAGETLVAVNAKDIQAQLVAQRSSFQRLLTSVMPDLRLDYNDQFLAWNTYLSDIDVNKTLPELPAVSSSQLKLFLTGRSIYTEYYTIKNSEINRAKFTIKVPFSGVLVEANADPGTVIRPGQKLGVFIKPSVYELEVALSAELVDKLEKGQKAELALDSYFDKTWSGTISRVNRTVNIESQLSSVFIKATGDGLRDGLFMHAKIQASGEQNAMEISRSTLFDENKVFLVKDSTLIEQSVQLKHLAQNTAVISGLKEGEELLTKIPPGAFAGMKVSIYRETESK